MTIMNKRHLYKLTLFIASVLIAGCSVISGGDDKKVTEDTLGSFAKSVNSSSVLDKIDESKNNLKIQLLTRQLTRKERTEKLATIYRSILSLEPDKAVRAQIQHRMIQLDIEQYEQNDVFENKEVLTTLVKKYKNFLALITSPEYLPENGSLVETNKIFFIYYEICNF